MSSSSTVEVGKTGEPSGRPTEAGQRRAPRFRVPQLTAVYDTGEGFWSGRVTDASENGLFVETAHDLPPGTLITVFLQAASEQRLPLEIRAEVVRGIAYDLDENWNRTPGMAFRLLDLSEAEAAEVRRFLEEHGVALGGGPRSPATT